MLHPDFEAPFKYHSPLPFSTGTGVLMLHLRGCPALSSFRKQKLLKQLQEHVPLLTGIEADYLHIAELDGSLSAPRLDILEQLLTYGPDKSAGETAGGALIVIPRPGTISPWSSKATDIVHNCGLEKVLRVERGIVYTLEFEAGVELSATQRTAILPLLHDRMTETVVFDVSETDVLFRHATPAPSQSIDILTGDVRRWRQPTGNWGWLCPPMKSITWWRTSRHSGVTRLISS